MAQETQFQPGDQVDVVDDVFGSPGWTVEIVEPDGTLHLLHGIPRDSRSAAMTVAAWRVREGCVRMAADDAG